jgi:Centromere DNA-binding protein complex CBF3 subunit, domain 2
MNPHPNPRNEALNNVLRTRRRNEHRRRRLEFTDRAAGTVQDGYDGYDETKIVKAVRFCWRGQRVSAESHLRTAVDFLSHNLLLRSEMRLGAKLPDFFTIQLPNEEPTPCHAMIMVMDDGKMNALGRLEYGALMMHRNPLLYTTFYLFYQWNITGEAPPCFRRR